MAEKRFSNTVNVRNKQATFNYELLDKFIAGIVLRGTEIKSIREGKVNLQDGYCYFSKGEMFVKGISITPYAQGTHYNHEAGRERKVLMKKAELIKLEAKTEEKGLALIPVRLFINDRGLAKLEIGLGRGKKTHDKRESIKERDVKRELNRIKIR
ncbi:MAG TPA: SsrA-binding protein SmpB [Cyclobacteriaceae bacterium]|jgi:SsrA-binding protein|nr:SsrA-binding protein SmpB [Cytophagales bacterium]HMR58863.1 SsrA-binding protein SmpB [Cyclobacteriaceae bacterium]HNT50859.1 SsrA-binding protein SmpB [Cyclobacteriaceae bacterium]HRE68432.1 SsrA-binding protein SmpB [Cyclobacteriaceae bacterium]HRF34821.1 SsrA-binding protein SmpB [Cyclobacteriaceae bacterium]